MKKILLIEDTKEIYQMVDQCLSSALTSLDWAQTLKEAEQKLAQNDFDLILLDLELPDGNGISLCSTISNKNPQLPIFILTSHDNLSEKVLGFSAGAEDYITKPFDPMELKARIEAKLKKAELLKSASDVLNWKEVKIDRTGQIVQVLDSGQYVKVDLTSLEFKLLSYFAARPNAVIDRETLLNSIWGKDVHVYPRSVDTHVSKLRKKLSPVSHIVESVHGTGYKFCPTN